jgi:8-oxo-dGTP pyrophosphatase MutT (NUDIX family)
MKEAAVGILFRSDEVLLVLRRDVPIWVLPGGGIDNEETPEEAAIREVHEETGLSVSIKRKVGLWLPINRLTSPAYVFECCPTHELPTTFAPQAESAEIRFWKLSELPTTLFFLHREWIDVALEKRAEPVTRMIASVTYLRCLRLIFCHPILCIRYILSRILSNTKPKHSPLLKFILIIAILAILVILLISNL